MIRTTLTALLLSTTALAAPLPQQARIVYDVLSGSTKLGVAEQNWTLQDKRYRLETELTPWLGPRLRYLSEGELGRQGLRPESYQEFRGNGDKPRRSVRFDWQANTARFDQSEDKLGSGTQDANAFVFQLTFLGDRKEASFPVATAKRLRDERLQQVDSSSFTLGARKLDVRIWRSADPSRRTEVWLAPQLHNLPVKLIRSDDDNEFQFVARTVEVQP
ncbi:DUF3108 domain-containing protein [Chitinimonas lacunae]|uniref:DUF3108 domain-containing protein n=1 Tax=Chitinimonas lacunae TaxID=1963018 RepID=A0ABV8MQ29_9NEIS